MYDEHFFFFKLEFRSNLSHSPTFALLRFTGSLTTPHKQADIFPSKMGSKRRRGGGGLGPKPKPTSSKRGGGGGMRQFDAHAHSLTTIIRRGGKEERRRKLAKCRGEKSTTFTKEHFLVSIPPFLLFYYFWIRKNENLVVEFRTFIPRTKHMYLHPCCAVLYSPSPSPF